MRSDHQKKKDSKLALIAPREKGWGSEVKRERKGPGGAQGKERGRPDSPPKSPERLPRICSKKYALPEVNHHGRRVGRKRKGEREELWGEEMQIPGL